MSESVEKRTEDGGTEPSPELVLAARWAVARRRLFATGPFPRAATWRRDLVDKWSIEDDVAPVATAAEEVEGVEDDKSKDDNPTIEPWDIDENGRLIVRDAWIGTYLGEVEGRQQYVLSLPRGMRHQTGPYVMHMEVPE